MKLAFVLAFLLADLEQSSAMLYEVVYFHNAVQSGILAEIREHHVKACPETGVSAKLGTLHIRPFINHSDTEAAKAAILTDKILKLGNPSVVSGEDPAWIRIEGIQPIINDEEMIDGGTGRRYLVVKYVSAEHIKDPSTEMPVSMEQLLHRLTQEPTKIAQL